MKLENKQLEELKFLGYTIIENFISKTEIDEIKKRINLVHEKQINEFGLDNLKLIHEESLIRTPFIYDFYFINLFLNDNCLNIIKQILGNYAILSLQNSIVIPPKNSHHQSFYHRDIIYQDFTSSIPLGVNFYYCLDDYSENTGGTCFIPNSHNLDKFPNSFEEITPKVDAGSVIIFDSMIYHRAGINKSDNFRYGVNQMFTLPFIKQQFDFSRMIQLNLIPDEFINNNNFLNIIGSKSKEYDSVHEFREDRLKRLKK